MDHITKLLKASDINEITFRYSLGLRMEQRPLVTTSLDANALLKPMFEETIEAFETFWLILLDRGNRFKGVVRISSGGVSGTVADPKIIFGIACRTLASSIIVAHNHPSGQLRPSSEDIHLTKKLREGGAFLDIVVQDHIIMTTEGYYSFADNGQL